MPCVFSDLDGQKRPYELLGIKPELEVGRRLLTDKVERNLRHLKACMYKENCSY